MGTRFFKCRRCGEFKPEGTGQPVTVTVTRDMPSLPGLAREYDFCVGCIASVERQLSESEPKAAPKQNPITGNPS